jgi:hypothetical protein
VFKWLLLAILFVLVVRALSRLMSGVLDGAGFRRHDTQPSVKLVRDPVCGMFVTPSKALAATAAGRYRRSGPPALRARLHGVQ